MKKKIASLLVILIVVLAGLCAADRVFRIKTVDGICAYNAFYELEKDTVDVLVLGSSHAYMTINPMVIWDDSGIAAFDLCGPAATMWNTYYDLKEALKTQHPRLVVLEAYCLVREMDYLDDYRSMENIFAMKPSANKWNNLKASFPKERFPEFALAYIQYHNRYNDLEPADFKKYMDDEPKYASWKGVVNSFHFEKSVMPKVVNDGTREEIPQKQAEYYEKIIELCRDEGRELLIVISPYTDYNEYDMGVFNSAKDIADAAGVPFVNFNENYDEIDFDWDTDFVDGSHMSWLGNARYSRYLSEYLAENYDWEDHSAERDRYSSWDEAYEYYTRSIDDHELTCQTDPGEYAKSLDELEPGYTIIVTVKNGIQYNENTKQLCDWLGERGIPATSSSKAAWIIDDEGVVLAQTNDYGYNWAKRFGKKELLVGRDGIYWDRTDCHQTDSGLNIVVFDENNLVVADSVGIEGDTVIRENNIL